MSANCAKANGKGQKNHCTHSKKTFMVITILF